MLKYTMISIVNIDDDKKWQSILRFSFSGYSIIPSYSGKSGINIVRNRNPDVVLLNKSINDMQYNEVLRKLKEIPGAPPVIVIGEYEKPQDVVASIKNGAVDYVAKPFELERLKDSILEAVRMNSTPGTVVDVYPSELEIMIGESKSIKGFKRNLLRFAGSDAAVLINGETGTGKDLAAQIIHRVSDRKNGPYLILNAGGIPVTLLETQLYGTVKGSYTGAVNSAGYFEMADKGTLFIDEIGEVPVTAQAKLLRILEENEIYRIGGRESIPVDVRVISATNKNVPEAIRQGSFRQDLFFRINTLYLHIPPLRERIGDIPLLADHFLSVSGKKKVITSSALSKLQNHDWPGNIRELRNVLLRAEVLSEGGKISKNDVVFDPI